MAGYSDRSLVDKLGIKPGMRIAIIDSPHGFAATLGKLPARVTVTHDVRGVLPFIHFFAVDREVLKKRFARLKRALEPAGTLWISWPKKTSGVATDLTEDVVRAIALAGGLVDVKVAAVDEVWSALKLVRRLKDR
ncbi:MAG TPA: DUF3052 domain-containing protein [Gemmatimonadales bacterium]|nr:DUF3052 domain-containing protein [Gemmatimonadales bacterium]